jgi:pimeloyl-ACP methyl ester carboxylesterase
LEGLCRATQCVIVATAIPVTWTENPLQHVLLSRKLQRQFQTAYVTVLEDEYGDTALADVPVVALGHSLGSRLLAVLATLAPPRNAAAPPYKSFILMSFTNYGASAGIPGVQQLMKSRNSLDAPKARSRRRSRNRSRYDEEDYDDDFDDDDLEELIEELQQNVWEQTTKIRDALTPLSQDLEFYPSPDQLWDALAKDKRFTVPETLIVQFDDDEVDQSARLASILKNTSNVKYARLRGNHLSPVAVEAKTGSWLDLPSKATKALVKVIRGKPIREKSTDTSTMRDLRQTIARYITDVVTK